MTATVGINAAELLRMRARSLLANIRTIAARELRESLGSRWFVLYTIAFAVLGLGVSYVSATSLGGAGLAGFGRTSAGLVNLVLLVVPLMSLTAGAGTIASDRERGMLAYLLAQPVSRAEVFWGKALGAALALLAALALVTLVLKSFLEWRFGAELAAARRH